MNKRRRLGQLVVLGALTGAALTVIGSAASSTTSDHGAPPPPHHATAPPPHHEAAPTAQDAHGTPPPPQHHATAPPPHHEAAPTAQDSHGSPPPPQHGTPPPQHQDDLHLATSATAQFRDVRAAEAAGYKQGSPCVSSPEGGMGFHWENPALMATDEVRAAHPEILLYAPGPHGLELVGIEYWKRDADQNLATSADRPTLFGRPFDGPMPGHAPGMPVHYDLHVWIWKDNPSGMFAPFNPTVTCPGPSTDGTHLLGPRALQMLR